MTPRRAQRCAELDAARVLDKQLERLQHGDAAPGRARVRQALGEAALAARLGLTPEALASADGLAELAAQNRLYNYLARYDDTCHVRDGEVWIKYADALTPWSAVPAPLKVPRSRERGEPWPYDASGLCDRNMDSWRSTRLEPLFYADPSSWGGGHVLSICTTAQPAPRLMERDHSFLRVYDPQGGRHSGEGAIYSFGFYRPGKESGDSPWRDPLRVKPGRVRLDFCEFWGEELTELPFRITRAQMKQILARAEADHAQGFLPFQLGSKNCTWYALDVAKLADVHVDATMGFARMLLPQPLGRAVQRAHHALPAAARPLLSPVSGLFWNLVQLQLGAAKVEPVVRARYPEQRGTLAGLGDAIRRASSAPQGGPSPWRLGREVTPKLLRERASRATAP